MVSYQEYVIPKMCFAQKVLALSEALPTEGYLTARMTYNALLVINYIKHNFYQSEIILDIHDLWSANLFARDYSYGSPYNGESRHHPLLKPYAEFTSEEKTFEDMLGMSDIDDIEVLLRQLLPEVCVDTPSTIEQLQVLVDKNATIRTFGVLAQDREFVLRMAFLSNENWMQVKARMGITEQDDCRLGETFEERLASDGCEILIENAKYDILAITVFLQRAL